MPMDRRRALAVLSGLAAAGLAGCGGEAPLRIAVVWSGWELSRFREVLDEPNTIVYSAGDNIAALLRNPVAPAATPDVAIVSRPGLVQDKAIRDRLQTISSPDDLSFWPRLLWNENDGSVKGAWFKVAHKSLVWYRQGPPTQPPANWDAWVRTCEARAKCGHPPLAIGAADGWVLSDWFENVLVGIDRDTYRRLNDQPTLWSSASVRHALCCLARLWSIKNLLPGGGRRALATQFHESVLDVFRYGRADMVAAGDFAWPVIDRYTPRPQGEPPPAKHFLFPGHGGPQPPVLVGGDAVVALKSSGERGRQLLERLTGNEATRLGKWAGAGGFLSLNPRYDQDYPDQLKELAQQVRGNVEFDLSDQLTGPLAGGDGQGLWRVLTELFASVTVGDEKPDTAVGRAMNALTALSEAGGS
ncbi:hypothetical protein OG589_20175 [Sphaerisporangium sp. NBC_01403]|uniref:hypothetical protein n=1 Tax=Sphaerisporangium sp. NBC_01403 TaxID=2903599 RepID=UPI00324D0471